MFDFIKSLSNLTKAVTGVAVVATVASVVLIRKDLKENAAIEEIEGEFDDLDAVADPIAI